MNDEQYRREYAEHLIESVKNGTITRRELLVRASIFGFSATTIGRLLTASGGSVAEAAPAPLAAAPVIGGTMKVVIPPPIKTLDPLTIYDQGGIVLVYQVSEYLIDISTTNAFVPKLATKWVPNAKGDVWTFTLRSGVKFNDGSPFEAADVVATFENILNPANGSAGLSALQGTLAPGGTKATGTHTVQFHLEKPFADFPALVSSASYNTAITKRDYKIGTYQANPIGTGAWMLKNYTVNQGCTMVANPTYWGKDSAGRKLPYLKEVDYVFVQSDQAAVLQLQSGAVDVQAQTAFATAAPLFSDPNIRVDKYPSSGMRAVCFNFKKAPWTDKRLRQAVAYSIDRPGINKVLYGGRSNLAYDTFWMPSVFPGSPTPTVRKQDIPKAKALLKAAGKPNLAFTLTTSQYLENPQYAQLIQAMCKKAGINVTLNIMSYDAYYAGTNANTPWLNAQTTMTEWGSRALPGQFAAITMLPTATWNASHYSNPTFTKTFNSYQSTADVASRKKLATKLSALQEDDVPIMISFFITQLRSQKKNVHGIGGPGSYYFNVNQAYIG